MTATLNGTCHTDRLWSRFVPAPSTPVQLKAENNQDFTGYFFYPPDVVEQSTAFLHEQQRQTLYHLANLEVVVACWADCVEEGRPALRRAIDMVEDVARRLPISAQQDALLRWCVDVRGQAMAAGYAGRELERIVEGH